MANFTAVAIDKLTGNNAPVFYFDSEHTDEDKALDEAKKLTRLSDFDRWNVVCHKGICKQSSIIGYGRTKTKPKHY